MIKVFALLSKQPHLTDAQFHAHWRHPHGTLTKKMRQIRRYVQNHGVTPDASLPGLASPGFQGVPSVWVPSVETLQDMFADPEYDALAADALLLYDQAALTWLVTEECVFKQTESANDATATPSKAMVFLKRSAFTEIENFETVALQAAASIADSSDSATACSYARLAAAAYRGTPRPNFDSVLEIAFEDRRALDATWPSIFQKLQTSPLGAQLELSECCGFVATEERVIWPMEMQ